MPLRNVRRNLHLSSWDGFFASLTVGVGETFFPAFILAVGGSEASSGLVATLPFLIGSTVQLFAPKFVAKFGSYRRWIVLLVILQAFSFLPLVLVAGRAETRSAQLIYFAITFYWIFGLSAASAWNAWLAEFVPPFVRLRYLAKRGHLCQLGLLLGVGLAGVILGRSSTSERMSGFAILFAMASVFRLMSGTYLARQSDGGISHETQSNGLIDGFREWGRIVTLKSNESANLGRLVIYLLFFSVSVQLASPFFAAYMLKFIGFSYDSYMVLVGASLVAKFFTFFTLARSRGPKWRDPLFLISIGFIGAALSPLLWLLSKNFAYLVFTQIVGGASWAAYELGLSILQFGVIEKRNRARVFSFLSFSTAITMALGSLIGGKILESFAREGFFELAFQIIFIGSTLLRLSAVFWLRKVTLRGSNPQVVFADFSHRKLVRRMRPRFFKSAS